MNYLFTVYKNKITPMSAIGEVFVVWRELTVDHCGEKAMQLAVSMRVVQCVLPK